MALSLTPELWEERARLRGVELEACERGGAGERGVAPVGEVWARGQHRLVGRDARLLKALAVRHDEVFDRDADAVEDELAEADLMDVKPRPHHSARRAVAQDRAALLQLHDARENFRRR